jgi:hypothetical protein
MAPELDRKKITEELEILQLEETRERVHVMRSRSESNRRRRLARQTDITNANLRQKAREADCWHKKGGKGVDNLAHGNDSNYAVVKHQLCHGPVIVICQRCGHVEEPPDPYLNRRGASKEEKAEYKRQWESYMWWFNLPTDNTQSGTQLFMIAANEAA